MRILFVAHSCFLDDSNGAAIAARSLVRALTRHGCLAEVLCGMVLDTGVEVDPARWLAGRGHVATEFAAPGPIRYFTTIADDLHVTLHRSPSSRYHQPDANETAGFLHLYASMLERFRPDVVLGYGGSDLIGRVFHMAHSRGIGTLFLLYNFSYRHLGPFVNVDAVVVPSEYSQGFYARTLGLRCHVVPCVVDPARFVVDRGARGEQFVLFVNPSREKGVFIFARIAHELGRIRPDIPFLVVEGRGTEATLVGCGLELLEFGNVFLMDHPPDARQFWTAARICLMPSVWYESQGLVAIEAMFNGIPVIASDRGALPETLGGCGTVLPLPDRLTLSTSELPTPEEVRPWLDRIIQLWDNLEVYEDAKYRSMAGSARWDESRLVGRFLEVVDAVVRKPGHSRTSLEPY